MPAERNYLLYAKRLPAVLVSAWLRVVGGCLGLVRGHDRSSLIGCHAVALVSLGRSIRSRNIRDRSAQSAWCDRRVHALACACTMPDGSWLWAYLRALLVVIDGRIISLRHHPGLNLTNILRVFAALVVLAVVIPCQGAAPKAHDFLPNGYGSIMTVDVKKMRDSGVWDELCASQIVRLFVGLYESESGISIDLVDRAAVVHDVVHDGSADVTHATGAYEVVTIEGNADLGDGSQNGFGRYTKTEVLGYTLHQDEWATGQGVLKVSPTLLVYGRASMLVSVLEGKIRGGLPSGDVMSFTAGHKNLLGYFIGDIQKHPQNRDLLERVLPKAVWPKDDEPAFFCVRLFVTGDEDDPHLQLDLSLRHGNDGPGLLVTEHAVAAGLKEWKAMKEMRILLPLLKKVTYERDRTDAVWRLDLGRARGFGGTLGLLAPGFLVYSGLKEAEAILAPAVEIEAAVDEAEPAPAKVIKPAVIEGGEPQVVEPESKPVTAGGGGTVSARLF